MNGRNIQSGRFARLFRVGSLATELGRSYLWQELFRPFRSLDEYQRELLETHLQSALRIVEESRELRGTFTKLVQMLSTRQDLFPSEVLDILGSVQSDAEPMDYATIRDQIRRDLGAPPEDLFLEFDREAFAAASLGQVHRARLPGGEAVAVKVQYPGVAETVEEDLHNVRLLLDAVSRIGRDVVRARVDTGSVSRELQERLREELDYGREAANLRRFGELFADDPDVIVPEVVHERSGRRVLTMTFVEGYPLKSILAPGVDREVKDWVGTKLFQILWRQLFSFGALHTDPHPGNYVVTFHPRLGILDFGSVREFPERVRKSYLRLARAIGDQDRDRMVTACHTLGFLGVDESADGMVRILETVLEPLLVDREYDPAEYRTLDRAMEVASVSLEHRLFRAPGHRLFLLRALVGLEVILQGLGTVANWRRLFLAEVAAAQRSGEP